MLNPRRRCDETGFSLIELMIVLLIIAILLAVAIPTYLSARNRAENRAAQETIAHTLVAAQADYASQGTFTPLDGQTTLSGYLTAQNPGVTVVGGGTTAVDKVNEVTEEHGNQYITVGSWAPDGKCFFALDIESSASAAISSSGVSGPGTYYGWAPSSNGGCSAFGNVNGKPWETTWAAAEADD